MHFFILGDLAIAAANIDTMPDMPLKNAHRIASVGPRANRYRANRETIKRLIYYLEAAPAHDELSGLPLNERRAVQNAAKQLRAAIGEARG
jgi:hypothetical protein